MVTPRTRLLTLLVATFTILLSSCGTEPEESPDVSSLADDGPSETIADVVPTDPDVDAAAEVEFEGSLTVEDQISDGSTVTVASAAIETEATEAARGWVVIHADESGRPGAILGHAQLPLEGPTEDLVVDLDDPAGSGVVPLWAMLHVDAAPEGTFEFPGPDVPVTVDGDPLVRAFELTVDSTS